jgi:hypothetical protein
MKTPAPAPISVIFVKISGMSSTFASAK